MKIKTLNIGQARALFDAWDNVTLPNVSFDYMQLRQDLDSIFKNLPSIFGTQIHTEYQKDVYFGIALKEYFDQQGWFNLRVASDIGFWRYLSVTVIPHLVAKRWTDLNEDHFWKKPSRIWLRSIWWFAYLGWSSDRKGTVDLLLKPTFNTDVILNTVERTGRKGTHISTYNRILQYYGSLEKDVVESFSKGKNSDTLFRSVMRLNTAKILVLEPALCEGGVDGYVRTLFEDVGICLPKLPNSTVIMDNASSASYPVILNEKDSVINYVIDDKKLMKADSVEPTEVVDDFETEHSGGGISLIMGDITKLHIDAIVNAANPTLLGGGGIDFAIHNAAGPRLLQECRTLNGCKVGQSKITSAYNLPCKYVIHTVGPNCNEGSQRIHRKELLKSCYNTCLDLVEVHNIRSVAFCCIGTGIFNFPKQEAAEIAYNTIRQRLDEGLECEVIICCYTQDDMRAYKLLNVEWDDISHLQSY